MNPITTITITQQDERLGRQLVHDERSRAFALRTAIDRTTWHDKAIRLWDPIPNPNQHVGCCTGAAKAMQLNAVGNRVIGRVLKYPDALNLYTWASNNDPWEGGWPPNDTGSSGLASAKAARAFGIGGEYFWEFDGADGVVQNIMEGRVMSVGTWWHEDMFRPDKDSRITPTGPLVGGHQYVARGYDKDRDWVLIRCWWGSYRDVWISRQDLDLLLRNAGDAHFQRTTSQRTY